MANPNVIPVYVPHEGTIKISGSTSSRLAARCALHFLAKGVKDLDFFFIGANAGQQTMKAIGIFRYIVEEDTNHEYTVFFQPNRVQTEVVEISGAKVLKDATFWRPYVVNIADFRALLRISEKSANENTEKRTG